MLTVNTTIAKIPALMRSELPHATAPGRLAKAGACLEGQVALCRIKHLAELSHYKALEKIQEAQKMAVQQRKKSNARRDSRRAHDSLEPPCLSIEPTTGEVHRRHHVSPDGYYKGRKVLNRDPGEEVE